MWSPPGQNRQARKKRRAEIADDPDFSADISLSGIPDQLRRPLEVVGDAYIFGRHGSDELWRLNNQGLRVLLIDPNQAVQIPLRVYTGNGEHLLFSIEADPLANDGSEIDLNIGANGSAYAYMLLDSHQRSGRSTSIGIASTDNAQHVTVSLQDTPAGTPHKAIEARRENGPLMLAFFGTTPVARPTVTGSRGGNAALASLLTALANLGLITDSTT